MIEFNFLIENNCNEQQSQKTNQNKKFSNSGKLKYFISSIQNTSGSFVF